MNQSHAKWEAGDVVPGFLSQHHQEVLVAASAITLHANRRSASVDSALCRICGDTASSRDGWYCSSCFYESTIARRNPRRRLSVWRLSPKRLRCFLRICARPSTRSRAYHVRPISALGMATGSVRAMSAQPSNYFPDEAQRCPRCRRELLDWQELRAVAVVVAVDEHGLDVWGIRSTVLGRQLRLKGELQRQYAFDSRALRARRAPRPFTQQDIDFIRSRELTAAQIVRGAT